MSEVKITSQQTIIYSKFSCLLKEDVPEWCYPKGDMRMDEKYPYLVSMLQVEELCIQFRHTLINSKIAFDDPAEH